jgi:threonine dehydrogenase-like Zn-dependent dehydrogenase
VHRCGGHGSACARADLWLRQGQAYEHIRAGRIDPTFVITHHMSLEDAAKGYDIFNRKLEGCEKIVLKAS